MEEETTTIEMPTISLANPYPAYSYLQQHAPVYKMPSGQWLVTDYKNASKLLQDSRCLHWGQDQKASENLPPVEKAIATALFTMSPEGDRPYRKQILHQLAARSLKLDETAMQQLAKDILQQLKGKREIDFIREFAHPFTFGTICRIIGIPENKQERLSNLVSTMESGYLACIDVQTGEKMEKGVEFIQHLRELINLKRIEPANDLCSVLLESSQNEPDQEAFLLSTLILLFYAGHQNMMNFLGNAILSLNEHPQIKEAFRKEPELMDRGVDELIRYDSPLQFIMLIAKENIVVGGKNIPAGSQLLVGVGAANRDPLVFENPATLNLNRASKHLGYGVGAFRCIGARLAQLQGAIGLNSWLEQVKEYKADLEKVTWRTRPTVQRGPEYLPLKITWEDEI